MMNFPVFYCDLTKPGRGYCVAEFKLMTEKPKETGEGEIDVYKRQPHPQHIELGSFHRTCQTEPVQQRLSSLELSLIHI